MFDAAGGYTPYKPTGGGGGGGGGGGVGGGGGGKGGRESQLPKLNQQVQAAQNLLNINRQILEAQYQENDALVQQLEAEKLIVDYENKIADALEKIPAAEKEVKALLAGIELRRNS